MEKDSLGNRMKSFYEDRYRNYLPRRIPAIIRLDGKSFHTFTKGMERPFDYTIINTMIRVAVVLCSKIQGCKLGYVQSDEISLLLTDWDNLNTEAWFDYNVQKIASVSASIATLEFNLYFRIFDSDFGDGKYSDKYDSALFDSRVFSLPKEEVANYFIWRQQDATRNSILSVAQAKFSHKELQNKNVSQLQDMLFLERNINFNEIQTNLKRGTGIIPDSKTFISPDGKPYDRNLWTIDYNIPVFTQEREYIERFLA